MHLISCNFYYKVLLIYFMIFCCSIIEDNLIHYHLQQKNLLPEIFLVFIDMTK